MRFAASFAFIGVLAVMCGCADSERKSDLGTGLNTIDRDYMVSAPTAYEGALEALKRSGLSIRESRCDSLGGDIFAQRADGSQVRITARSLDEESSRVTIRVEPGDAALVNILHERTACELGLCRTGGVSAGGNFSAECYKMTIAEATEAARSAMAVCGLSITHEETHLAWVEIEGCQQNSNLARIRISKCDAGCVDVSFYAGAQVSLENRDLARRMKAAFDAKVQ